MVLALRCLTGAPEELRKMFQDGAAVCDGLRAADEKVEDENGQVCGCISLLAIMSWFCTPI